MKKIAMVVSFIVGCTVLFVAVGIGWADWWELANRIRAMQIFMGALGLFIAFQIAIGILNKSKERWTPLILAAILLLGFSGLAFFSVGWLMAPIALLLLGFSIWKLLRRQP